MSDKLIFMFLYLQHLNIYIVESHISFTPVTNNTLLPLSLNQWD
jgi:hypothetical protein